MPFTPNPSSWIPGMTIASGSVITPCTSDWQTSYSYNAWFHGNSNIDGSNNSPSKFEHVANGTISSAALTLVGGKVNGRPISVCAGGTNPHAVIVDQDNLTFTDTPEGNPAVFSYLSFLNDICLSYGLNAYFFPTSEGYRPNIGAYHARTDDFVLVLFENLSRNGTALQINQYMTFVIGCCNGKMYDSFVPVYNDLNAPSARAQKADAVSAGVSTIERTALNITIDAMPWQVT